MDTGKDLLKHNISRRNLLKFLAAETVVSFLESCVPGLKDHDKAVTVSQSDIPVVLLPGNYDYIYSQNWLETIGNDIEENGPKLIDKKIGVWKSKMPDSFLGKTSEWGPLVHTMSGPNTIAVGHSTGATELLYRLSEGDQFDTVILVAAYDTPDLGQPFPTTELEKEGGRFQKPWNWENICKNAKHIIIISPTSDDIIPQSVTKSVRDNLEKYAQPGQLEFINPEGSHDVDSNPGVLSAIKTALYNALSRKN